MKPSRKDALRVVMISQGYYPIVGGAERQVTLLSGELARRGIDVHVLTRCFPGLKSFEQVEGVSIHRLPAPRPKVLASLVFMLSALRTIHQLRPDILHAHELFSPTTTAVAAGKMFGIPVVATVHGGGEIARLLQKTLGKTRLRIFGSEVDCFVTINRVIDEQLASLGIPTEHRRYIPNGVNSEHFCPVDPAEKERLRSALHLSRGPVIIYAGRLVGLKRVDQLISAWSEVHRAYPAAELLIIGSGPEENSLKNQAASLQINLGKATPQGESGIGIRFLGEIQDVAPYLQTADLFVLPSSREGLSVALLEAQACGLPVVAVDVGGNADLIQHLRTGWLIPSDSSQALSASLAVAICALLADAGLREKIGRFARELVIQSYSLRNIADHLHQLYIDLLDQRTIPEGGQA
jgi:glycosyltransferase involved in cell wall biosynthesis